MSGHNSDNVYEPKDKVNGDFKSILEGIKNWRPKKTFKISASWSERPFKNMEDLGKWSNLRTTFHPFENVKVIFEIWKRFVE